MNTRAMPNRQRLRLVNEYIRHPRGGEAHALTEDMSTNLEVRRFGNASLGAIESRNLRLDRTRQLISNDDAQFATFVFGVNGTVGLSQGGRDAGCRRGSIAIFDGAQTLEWSMPNVASRQLIVPKAALGSRLQFAEDRSAVAFEPDDPVQRVTYDFMMSLFREADNGLDETTGKVLINRGVELLLLVAERNAGQIRKVAPSAYKAALTQRIKVYIETNLKSSRLSISGAASALGMSERYVNLLLNLEGTSFNRMVLNRRLENCYAELRDPSRRSAQILEIAYEWGFVSQAHFSRVFRQRYDMSPSEYRNQALP